MSHRSIFATAQLVLLAVLTLFAAPSEAEATLFRAFVQNYEDNAGVTLTLITRDALGGILDEVPMVFIEVDQNDRATFEIDFACDAASVTWEVVATPLTRFNPSTIQDGDDVDFQNDNVLEPDFDLL